MAEMLDQFDLLGIIRITVEAIEIVHPLGQILIGIVLIQKASAVRLIGLRISLDQTPMERADLLKIEEGEDVHNIAVGNTAEPFTVDDGTSVNLL